MTLNQNYKMKPTKLYIDKKILVQNPRTTFLGLENPMELNQFVNAVTLGELQDSTSDIYEAVSDIAGTAVAVVAHATNNQTVSDPKVVAIAPSNNTTNQILILDNAAMPIGTQITYFNTSTASKAVSVGSGNTILDGSTSANILYMQGGEVVTYLKTNTTQWRVVAKYLNTMNLTNFIENIHQTSGQTFDSTARYIHSPSGTASGATLVIQGGQFPIGYTMTYQNDSGSSKTLSITGGGSFVIGSGGSTAYNVADGAKVTILKTGLGNWRIV